MTPRWQYNITMRVSMRGQVLGHQRIINWPIWNVAAAHVGLNVRAFGPTLWPVLVRCAAFVCVHPHKWLLRPWRAMNAALLIVMRQEPECFMAHFLSPQLYKQRPPFFFFCFHVVPVRLLSWAAVGGSAAPSLSVLHLLLNPVQHLLHLPQLQLGMSERSGEWLWGMR